MKQLVILLLFALVPAGCRGPDQPPQPVIADLPPPTSEGAPMKLIGQDFASQSPNQYALVVRLKLATIEVPVGTASGTEQIWSYVDEEAVRAVRSAAMTRNGFRVGVARGDNWPDLARVLRRMTGRRIEQSSKLALPGAVMPLVLKQGQPVQTIFIFHEDRTLSGCDYPEGDNVLMLACTLDGEDPTRLMVTGLPQIRSKRLSPQIVEGPSGPMIVSRPAVFPLEAMTFQLAMKSQDVLVIGPGAEASRPGSAGSHFLVKMRDGVRFETLLVIVPEVFAAPARTEAHPPPGDA